MKFIAQLMIVYTSTILCASEHELGVGAYKADCQICHGTPYKGSTMLTTDEWVSAFANNYADLKKTHINKPDVIRVLDSAEFKRKSKYLLNFLSENSSDSGRVRGCSSTSCG